MYKALISSNLNLVKSKLCKVGIGNCKEVILIISLQFWVYWIATTAEHSL